MKEYIEREPILEIAKKYQGDVFGIPLIIAAIENAQSVDLKEIVRYGVEDNGELNVEEFLQIYIRQLEDENLRLKQSNKALRNNNKGLLESQKKLQRQIGKFKSKRIEMLRDKILEMKYECTDKGLDMCDLGLDIGARKYAHQSFAYEKVLNLMRELGI